MNLLQSSTCHRLSLVLALVLVSAASSWSLALPTTSSWSNGLNLKVIQTRIEYKRANSIIDKYGKSRIRNVGGKPSTCLFMSARNEEDSDYNGGTTNKNSTRTPRSSISGDNENEKLPASASIALTEMRLCRKQKQKRRQMRTRRPSTFWADIDNIETELRTFWSSVNVPIDPDLPPPIPNEALLNHFERHDLRYAIANMGGRIVVAEKLGGAKLIPGKWFEACSTSKEVQCLLKPDNPAGAGLTRKNPPIAPHFKRVLAEVVKQTRKIKSQDVGHDKDEEEGMKYDDTVIHHLRYQAGERWAHRSNRNPRGFWDEDVITKELYNYLACVKEEEKRPSVWMARQGEITKAGRDDLKQAITRFGGNDYICQLARLIPYKEWRYFESCLELFVELQLYLVMHEDGREDLFPKLSDVQNKDHERLYDLIMEYGGRKMIATKLDMDFQAQTKVELLRGMSFGKFSLDFAIRLMHFIRKEMLKQEPPLENPTIRMPTIKELISKGETKLAKDVMKYGGHEGIARRLNLSFDHKEAKRDALSKARNEAAEKADRNSIAKSMGNAATKKMRIQGDTSY